MIKVIRLLFLFKIIRFFMFSGTKFNKFRLLKYLLLILAVLTSYNYASRLFSKKDYDSSVITTLPGHVL
jgi:hypothetical protein